MVFIFLALFLKKKMSDSIFILQYTHPQEFEYLSERSKKLRKGKSCFHVKYLNEELESEIKDMVCKAIDVYKRDGLLM